MSHDIKRTLLQHDYEEKRPTLYSCLGFVSTDTQLSTAAELPRIGNISSNRTKVTYCDLHHLDCEEDKQVVTENTNSDNRDASMGRDWRARRPWYSDSEEEEEDEVTPL